MGSYIRWVLTLGLIYGAYTETGIWTAISLLLIFLSIEIQVYNIAQLFKKGN